MSERKAIFFAYKGDGSKNYPLLEWAGSDAVLMRKTFDGLGFQCCDLEDTLKAQTHKEVRGLIADFTDGLCNGDLLVLYFAGHGIGIGEKDVLLLVGENQYIRLIDIVYNILKGAYDAVIFLDCCRSKDTHKIGDSSSATDSESSKIGMERSRNFLPMNVDLSRYERDSAMPHDDNGARIVFYACQDGGKASDGNMNTGNSPFAQSLHEELKSSKNSIHDTLPDGKFLKRIQEKVKQKNGQQKPDRQEFPEGKEYPVLVKGSMRKPLCGVALLAILCAVSWLYSVCPTETKPDNRPPQAQYEMALALQERPLFKAMNKANAVKWLQSAADAGVADAQVALAEMYENGCCGVEKNERKAFSLYQQAKSHNAKASTQVGWYHYFGKAGVLVDKEIAFKHFYQGAVGGYVPAQMFVAKTYLTGDIHEVTNYTEAARFYSMAAGEKNADAMYCLYRIYRQGNGDLQANPIVAKEWLEESAKGGSLDALYALGKEYEKGEIYEQDYSRAFSYYTQAADRGYPKAEVALAECWERKIGVEMQSDDMACTWYRKAAEHGNADAQNALGFAYHNGLGGCLNDDNESFKWFLAAAQQGLPKAERNLGICYIYGIGCAINDKEGFSWISKAASRGYARAENTVAVCYRDGIGVKQDNQQALMWLTRAVEHGDDVARYNLGKAYENGDCGTQDLVKAFNLYQEAALNGNIKAQESLARCYREGIGVKKDADKAKYWQEKVVSTVDVAASSRIKKEL